MDPRFRAGIAGARGGGSEFGFKILGGFIPIVENQMEHHAGNEMETRATYGLYTDYFPETLNPKNQSLHVLILKTPNIE